MKLSTLTKSEKYLEEEKLFTKENQNKAKKLLMPAIIKYHVHRKTMVSKWSENKIGNFKNLVA